MIKRCKKFDSLLKQEFQRKYNYDLHASDIEGLDLIKKKKFDINLYWKWSSICSTCLVVVLLAFFLIGYNTGLLSTLYHFKLNNNGLENPEYVLTLDERMFIMKECNYNVDFEPELIINLKDNTKLYIYRCVKFEYFSDDNITYNNIYYCSIKGYDPERFEGLTITIDKQKLVLNKEQTICKLGEFLYSEFGSHNNEVSFKVKYKGTTTRYMFTD